MNFKSKYGKTAMIAGASEGIGAAFAIELAKMGMDLVLIARDLDKLNTFADLLKQSYKIEVQTISSDLSDSQALDKILKELNDKEIDVLIYNAALIYIGDFEKNSLEYHTKMNIANMMTPMSLAQILGAKMIERKRGGIVLMSSMAGFQGSGGLTMYAATKAFNRVLAEGLWYEWRDKGVDVMACCAGATSTPNYQKTSPEKTSVFAPKVQTPEEVVSDCLPQLGRHPSYTTGIGNRMASFFMHRFMPRRLAIMIMGDTTKRMYRLP